VNKKIIFITGGAKSGKSTFALKKGFRISGNKAFIATAEALDEEMQQRIENHKLQRGNEWVTYEEPLKIADVINRIKGKYSAIIIDCLTLWLSNLIHSKLDTNKEIENLINALNIKNPASRIYIVSNEVGMGIVPDNKLARIYRDSAGSLNQKIAEIADEVYLLVSGIPLKLKG
jgi:adenosylcobinamide kinase/adenosylcobinamide-phosphate guanylyltransferase